MPGGGECSRQSERSVGLQRYSDTRGSRLENREDGLTIDEVIQQFPVTREQIKAVLEFAARSLDPAIPAR
jgi:hypothetical protein